MAPQGVRRGRRPAPCHDGAAQRDSHRTRAARRAADGAARRRQDHARSHPGALPELREGSDRHALRELRLLQRDHRQPLDRCSGDRRGEPHRRRRHPRGDRVDPVPTLSRQVSNLRHRRGPHAVEAGLQRAAQDARGTATQQPVHLGDHRSREDPVHRDLALPALRPAPHRRRGGRSTAESDRRSGGHPRLADEPARHRSRGRRLDARRADPARSVGRLRRQRDRGRDRGRGPRPGRSTRPARDRRCLHRSRRGRGARRLRQRDREGERAAADRQGAGAVAARSGRARGRPRQTWPRRGWRRRDRRTADAGCAQRRDAAAPHVPRTGQGAGRTQLGTPALRRARDGDRATCDHARRRRCRTAARTHRCARAAPVW